MIWRAWVWNPVSSNFGCIVLLSKSYLIQINDDPSSNLHVILLPACPCGFPVENAQLCFRHCPSYQIESGILLNLIQHMYFFMKAHILIWEETGRRTCRVQTSLAEEDIYPHITLSRLIRFAIAWQFAFMNVGLTPLDHYLHLDQDILVNYYWVFCSFNPSKKIQIATKI